MSRKTIALLFVLVLFPVILYIIWPSDEARIRKLVRESAAAFEKEDIEGIMKYVSFSYRDEYGLSYALLKQNFQRRFKIYSDIDVEYGDLEIEVGDGTSSARTTVRVLATTGNQRGYIFGDLKTPAKVFLELERNPTGKWLITKASSGFEPEDLM